MSVIELVTDRGTSEFYPTPEAIANKMFEGIRWEYVSTVLEPSCGKGDILKALAKKLHNERTNIDIDCIELDANLRCILKHNFAESTQDAIREEMRSITGRYSNYVEKGRNGWEYFDTEKRKTVNIPADVQKQLDSLAEKRDAFFEEGIHVVHDNFLTYEPFKNYDVILMNPPFSNGDKHLLKALEIQKYGGKVVCLLNAETIRNPYTETRKHLVKLLNEYNADIEYIREGFSSAERKTDVEIALIKVDIPRSSDDTPSIYDRMVEAENYAEPTAEECRELDVTDFIKSIVNRYRIEIKSGIELIHTFRRMSPYLNSHFDEKKNGYSKSLIQLVNGDGKDLTVNKYVKSVRYKYWEALLLSEKFVGRLTGKLQDEYRRKIHSFSNYDFSEFNIYELYAEINAQVKRGIEEEIEVMYDRLTEEHSYYPECSKNKHLYDGWKTNKAWKIEKKCIVPCYGVFDSWYDKPRTYEAHRLLADIERILNFFDGNMTADIDLYSTLEYYFDRNITKKVKCKFFDLTFYKKGTVHIEFTCPELIDRFNIYMAKKRKWLPPSYAQKAYDNMTDEEKAVVNSFHQTEKEQKAGKIDTDRVKREYTKILSRPDYYLASPVQQANPLMIGLATEPTEEAV